MPYNPETKTYERPPETWQAYVYPQERIDDPEIAREVAEEEEHWRRLSRKERAEGAGWAEHPYYPHADAHYESANRAEISAAVFSYQIQRFAEMRRAWAEGRIDAFAALLQQDEQYFRQQEQTAKVDERFIWQQFLLQNEKLRESCAECRSEVAEYLEQQRRGTLQATHDALQGRQRKAATEPPQGFVERKRGLWREAEITLMERILAGTFTGR